MNAQLTLSTTAWRPLLLIALHWVELLCALVGSALWQLIFKLHLQPVNRLQPKQLDIHLANPMNTFMIHNIDYYRALYIGMKPNTRKISKWSASPHSNICHYGHHPGSPFPVLTDCWADRSVQALNPSSLKAIYWLAPATFEITSPFMTNIFQTAASQRAEKLLFYCGKFETVGNINFSRTHVK